MAKNGGSAERKKKGRSLPEVIEAEQVKPRCLAVAEKGITNDLEAQRYLSFALADLHAGRMSHTVANAGANIVSKMLKLVELKHRFGQPGGNRPASKKQRLELAPS